MRANIFKKFASFILYIFVLSFVVPSTTLAITGAPSIISYQGRLTDSSGNLLGGAGTLYAFKFSIWDNSVVGAGTKLWPAANPGVDSVQVTDGVFNVRIGDTANGYPDTLNYNFQDNANVYLQIEVSSDGTTFETLGPRQQITSAGYAINAQTLQGLTPGTGANNLLQLGSNGEINLSGNGISTLGNVGLGTVSSGVWHGDPIADGYFVKTGNWEGNFGGYDSSYYLNATHLSNFQIPFDTAFATKTTDSLAEGSLNKYFTDTRARNAISVAGAPLSYDTSTGVVSIAQADSTHAGFVSAADYNTFNNKQDVLISGTNIKTINSNSLLGAGDISVATLLGYTPYNTTNPSNFISNIGGLVTPGTNVSITGSGTAIDPFVITSTNPGGTVTSFAFTNSNGFTGSVSNSGTTPTLTLALQYANSTQDGQLSATDYNTFNNKQDTLGYTPYNATNPAGYISNLNALTTTNLNEGSNLYFTNARAISALTGQNISLLNNNAGYITGVSWGGITGLLANQTDLQNALNAKQNVITLGTTAQYLRGDLSLGTFPTAVSSFTNDANYITTAGARSAISVASTPLTYNSSTGVVGINQANSTTDGFVSSTDWNTFNNKFSLPALTSGSVVFANGSTLAQDNNNYYWDSTNARLAIGGSSSGASYPSVAMTGASTPSPYVASASTFNTGFEAYRAFDNNSGTNWNNTASTGWLAIDLGSTTTINKYQIQALNSAGTVSATPKTWTLEGSTTGAWAGEQVIIDTQASQTGWTVSEIRTFTLSSAQSYRYYRINISATNGYPTIGITSFVLQNTSPIHVSPLAKLHITAGSNTEKGLIVQGAASQTANLQEWQDSAGGILSYMTPAGNIGFGYGSHTISIDAPSSNSNGSNLTIIAGATTGTGYTGGNLYLLPGATAGGGSAGSVWIGGNSSGNYQSYSNNIQGFTRVRNGGPNTNNLLALAGGSGLDNWVFSYDQTNKYAITTYASTYQAQFKTATAYTFDNNVGVGTISPSARLHSLATTEQLRLGYDTANYMSTTIGSTGNATLALTGTGTPAFTFSNPINISGALTATSITNSSLTQGSVLFAGVGGLESQDNNNYYWDSTNARLAIGGYLGGTVYPTTAMTANNLPSPYVASASSVSGGYPEYQAFDKNASTFWASLVNNPTGWIAIDLGSTTTINRYQVQATSGGGNVNPKNWTLEGSTTGAWAGEQVVLDTQTNQTGLMTGGAILTYTLSSNQSYRYYRLNVSANNGATNYLEVASFNVQNTNTTHVAPLAKLHITSGSQTEKGLIVQGYASQTANLQEWQDSTGAVKAYIDPFGQITSSSNIYATGTVTGGNGRIIMSGGLTNGANGSIYTQSGQSRSLELVVDQTAGRGMLIQTGTGYVGVGTTSPTSMLDVATNALGTTQTTTSGLALENNTAGALNAMQISPAVRMSGQGWYVNGSVSQQVDARMYVLPVQGTSANATTSIVFDAQDGSRGGFNKIADFSNQYGGTSGNLNLYDSGVIKASLFAGGNARLNLNGGIVTSRGSNIIMSTSVLNDPNTYNMGMVTSISNTLPQFSANYNATNYFTTTVGSTGNATLALTGTGTPSFTFSNPVNISGALTATNITNSSLTQGSVIFAGAGGVESQDNNNYYWDSVNNRLSIGGYLGGTVYPTSSMTTNSLPSPYVATSSGSQIGGYESFRAFDGVLSSAWAVGTTSGWLALDTGNALGTTINKYQVQASNPMGIGIGSMPKNWTIEGSTTGAWAGEQVTIDTQTNQTAWSLGEIRTYPLSTPQTYRYYRINISANNGSSSYTGIGAFNLQNTATTHVAPLAKLHITSGSQTEKGLIVQGYNSQTANLQEWQDSSGSIKAYVDSGGTFNTGATIVATGSITGGNGRVGIGAGLTSSTNGAIYSTSGKSLELVTDSTAGRGMLIQTGTGNVGIGTTSPSAKTHILGTTEQLRLGYDASNYMSTTIGSTGNATLALTGTGTPAFTFSNPINISGALTATSITNSSLTQGSVLFAGVGGLESQDNNNYYWDSSTQRLAIGGSSSGSSYPSVVMTGNSSPSPYVASASGTNYGAPWNAFDNNSSTTWKSNVLGSGWLAIDLGSVTTINKYQIQVDPVYTSNQPKTWTLEGSTTGAWGGEQVTLDTQASQTGWAVGEIRTFTLSSSQSYRYFRINVTAVSGVDNVVIASFVLQNTSPTHVSPLAKLHITAGSNIEKGLIVQGVASQTANLQEWQSSTGSILSTINSSGYLGIGTSTPRYQIELNSGTANSSLVLSDSAASSTSRGLSWTRSSDGTVFQYISATTDSGNMLLAAYHNVLFVSGSGSGVGMGLPTTNNFLSGKLHIRGESSDTSSNTYTGTNALYVENSLAQQLFSVANTGSVGIGTNTPTSLLQVTQRTTGAGTVTNTAGGTTVTGTGTQFTNTFKVGDTITIGGQTVAISAIASDTGMTTAAITNANTNAAYTLVGGNRFAVSGNGNTIVGPATYSPSNAQFFVSNSTYNNGSGVIIDTSGTYPNASTNPLIGFVGAGLTLPSSWIQAVLPYGAMQMRAYSDLQITTTNATGGGLSVNSGATFSASLGRINAAGTRTSVSGQASSFYSNVALTAAATNDILASYYINDTYVPGAFTGVTQYGIYQNNTAQNYFQGNVGVGTATPSAKLHSLSTGEQLRLGYDASNYTAFTTSSTGNLTINPSGAAVQIAGNSALIINPGNGTLGVGVSAPTAKVDIADIALAGSGSLAGSVLNIAQTWNTSGSPTAIKLAVTNTASNATSSYLLDLQANNSGGGMYSKFSVRYDGYVVAGSSISAGGAFVGLTNGQDNQPIIKNNNTAFGLWTTNSLSSSYVGYGTNITLGMNMNSTGNFGFSTTATATEKVTIADTTLAGSGSLTGSVLNLTQTWNTTGAPTAIKLNVTNTASTGTPKLLDLQVGGVSKFYVPASGSVQAPNGIVASSGFTMNGGLGIGSAFAGNGSWGNSSGSNVINGVAIYPTINLTGTYSGSAFGFSFTPTITSSTGSLYAFYSSNGMNSFTDTISASSGSRAGSLLSLNQKWNTTGSPTAILLNVTNGSGGAGVAGTNANLMDLQMGGTSMFAVGANGNVGINGIPTNRLSVMGASGDTTVVNIGTTSGNNCSFSTTTGSWSCASDIRLKHDISDISAADALAKLGMLNPVFFRYNWQADSESAIAGFIAQDFEKVFPELVNTDPNTGYKSLSYAPLMPYVVKGLNDQEKKISDMDIRVSKLETILALATPSTNSFDGVLASMNANVIDGVAHFKSLFVDTIHVDKGIEMKDQTTGALYCVVINNGDWVKNPGPCDTPVVVPLAPTPAVSVPTTTTTPNTIPDTPVVSPTPSTTDTSTPSVTTTVTPDPAPSSAPVVAPTNTTDSAPAPTVAAPVTTTTP